MTVDVNFRNWQNLLNLAEEVEPTELGGYLNFQKDIFCDCPIEHVFDEVCVYRRNLLRGDYSFTLALKNERVIFMRNTMFLDSPKTKFYIHILYALN